MKRRELFQGLAAGAALNLAALTAPAGAAAAPQQETPRRRAAASEDHQYQGDSHGAAADSADGGEGRDG